MSFWDGTQWIADDRAAKPPPRRSRTRHVLEAALEGALLSLLIVALVAGTAFAGRGGSGNITVPDGVYAGTVTASVNPGGSGAWARASCYQGGSVVYVEYVRVSGDNQATFTLGPTPSWTGGDASCVAEELALKSNGGWRILASTKFNVSG